MTNPVTTEETMADTTFDANATHSTIHEDVFGEVHLGPTRTIAIAVDASDYSKFAFQWAIDNLIRPDTDQVVILNVR